MCDFFSAIIRRDGAIFHLPSNSHSGIVDHYKLTENDTIAEMRGKARFYEFEWNGLGPVPKIESLLRGDNPPKAVTDAAKVLAGNLSRAMAEPGWGLLDDGFFAGEEYADLRWKALISENLDHRIADRLAVLSLHAQGESVKSIHSLVTKIDGNLVIAEDASLTVPALTSVGGSVYVSENASLTVPALTSVGGYVDVSENASLTVPALTSVGGSVYVSENASLTVPALTSVGGYVDVRANASLTVPALTSVGGSVYVSENASLTVPALTSVGGSVDVSENASLTVPALTSVGGSVYVRANASLTVPALTSVGGSVDVSENASLTVPALTSVGGSVDVHSKAKKAEMPKKFLKR